MNKPMEPIERAKHITQTLVANSPELLTAMPKESFLVFQFRCVTSTEGEVQPGYASYLLLDVMENRELADRVREYRDQGFVPIVGIIIDTNPMQCFALAAGLIEQPFLSSGGDA